jgi:hypothetical protein
MRLRSYVAKGLLYAAAFIDADTFREVVRELANETDIFETVGEDTDSESVVIPRTTMTERAEAMIQEAAPYTGFVQENSIDGLGARLRSPTR